MANTKELKTHVPEPTKRTAQALAAQQGMMEAAWLRGIVETVLQASNSTPADGVPCNPTRQAVPPARVTIRLRPDDHELLAARAEARHLAPATYVSFFLRAHLRSLAPLPSAELGALKRAVAELGAVGRNINQIARVAHQGSRTTGLEHQELVALFKVCEGLRDHVKALIKANLASWGVS